MSIFRVKHNKNYTVINNTIASDKRLSWKAKGLFLYAFSRRDDWEFNVQDLINQSTDGKDSVYAGLRELEAAGYLKRERYRNDDGTFSRGADWTFYETPQEELKECLPKTENPHQENPVQEKPPLVSTDKKVSTEKEINTPPTPSKPKAAKAACEYFGSHVRLQKEEYEKLCADNTKEVVDNLITEMNDYCQASKPKGYIDYAAALRQWINRRKTQPKTQKIVYENPKDAIRKRQMDDYIKHNGSFDDNTLRF